MSAENSKKVVICVSMKEEPQIEELKHLKDATFFEGNEVHLVSIFKVGTYLNELTPYSFPSPQQFPEIERTILEILENLAKEIIPPHTAKKVVYKCLFHSTPKVRMVEYLNETKADLVVTAIRPNHGVEGLFMSSFTDYLCKFSPCDIYVTRPLKYRPY